MRYSQINSMDISNGIGIACSIFFQGCSRHCFNCFNTETWSFKDGREFTETLQLEFEKLCKKPYIDCVSFLGGEPLDQPLDELLYFIKTLKTDVNKPFFMWSGYIWEEIITDKKCLAIMQYVDYLIDGKYEDDLKDYKLKLRGSSNQRVIDVQASLKKGKVIEKYNF